MWIKFRKFDFSHFVRTSANQPFSFVLFRKDLISQMGEISISVITQSRKNLRRRNFCVDNFLQMVLFFAWNNFCDLSPIRERIFIYVKTRGVNHSKKSVRDFLFFFDFLIFFIFFLFFLFFYFFLYFCILLFF